MRGVLSGWGVELAIKNSEYKAVDDSKVKGMRRVLTCSAYQCVHPYPEDDSRVVEQAAEGGEDIEGFIFSTLR